MSADNAVGLPAVTRADSDSRTSVETRPSGVFKAFADVPILLTIEIGRLQVGLGELIALQSGDILRVSKPVGEPFDICANGQAVARGEIMVIENNAGIRLSEIIKLGQN